MTIKSNLYVERVNSEHPTAVWMLNEDIDYISWLTESKRQIEDPLVWTLTNCSAVASTSYPVETLFPSSHLSKISPTSVPATATDIILTSVFYTDIAKFNTDLKNFCLSGNVYITNPYINSMTFGYKYYNTATSTNEQVVETKLIGSAYNGQWFYFAKTFDNPPTTATSIQIIIKFNLAVGGSATTDYDLFLNGLTFGQWSEGFNKNSLGLELASYSPPANFVSGLSTIEALPYGGSDSNAYYIRGSNNLYAVNFGVPIVYGSSNVTKLYPNPNGPSLVFPGYGFLNEKGKFDEYTAEMWIRVNADTSEPRRFFGPVSSTDGLYIQGGFLTLAIGNNYESHYVGEWYRPMLIHIRYTRNNISVLVNGEKVIGISFIDSDFDFPPEYKTLTESNDWLGFYAYEDVHPLEIDSFAIYSYSVPNEVAKRRFVWGQGIIAPEQTNSSLNAITSYNDYTYSKYAVNYNYPDFAKWSQGFFSNVIANSKTLELPDYKLPTFSLGSKTLKQWYSNMQLAEVLESTKYFTFRPDISWSSQECYMYFDNFKILNENIESMYGVFESNGLASSEVLFKLVNKFTKDYMLVSINGAIVSYNINISGNTTTIATKTITANQKFTAGFNINNLSQQSINGISKFFGNESELTLYIAGTGTNTFTGKIFHIGFDAKYNDKKINTLYNSVGIFSETLTDANTMLTHTANYTLEPFEKYGSLFADISVAGYWEDYIPLSYFAKYVTDYNGDTFYDLDYIQLNLDFPEPKSVLSNTSSSSWSYADLNVEYSDPTARTYAGLDNEYYTGFANYTQLAGHSNTYTYFNTTDNEVRSYISFQNIVTGANKSLVEFLESNKKVARTNAVVDTEIITGTWENLVYEVVDGTVIFPPKTDQKNVAIDFNDYALVSHIDINVKGILHKKLKIRNLQLASQVLERSSFSEVGTKFGTQLNPYVKTGIYYDFKAKNPITTYKGSTPHLYLTRHSGWNIRKGSDDVTERGLGIAINTQQAQNVEIAGIQMWVRYENTIFPQAPIKIFSIESDNGKYEFFLNGDATTQRGYIYAINASTDAIITNIEYSLNGNPVDIPYLVNEEWAALGIKFGSVLKFNSTTGSLNLNGPLTYNNISYYLSTNLDRVQNDINRKWSEVASGHDWQYWKDWKTTIWNDILVISSNSVGIMNLQDVYAKYVGTNRFIIDDNIKGIRLNPDKLKVYNAVSWSSSINTAV